MEFKIPQTQIEVRALVRDKHGRPKFDDPAKIKHFLHRLSDEDIEYLKEVHGDNFHSDDSSA